MKFNEVINEENKRRMSRAAKGVMKYGKDGMKELAKAGREGASEKTLDSIRDKHDNYNESWSQKYKNSINCSHPKGFSQKAHCAGKKKHNESIEMEMTCEDCGMCQTHGNLNEIKKGQKDSNGFTKCWPNKHAAGTKKGKNGGQVRNCVPNESVEEAANAAQQAAIAVNMKKHHVKPKHMSEDEQIDGMAKGEIKAIISNAIHIQKALEHGIELDGWMYSYVTTSNDHLNSVAEQIGNPDIEEVEANAQFDMIEAMMEDLAVEYGIDSDSVWDLFETVSDSELLAETAAWEKSSGKNKNGGLNQKGVNSYRREHPGSKLQTAVTTKPSKLKKGSKAAKRRKSFCARMKGMKKHRTGAKTAHDPNSRINKSLRKWNC